MSIVSGFKKVKNYIKETDGYKLLSRWTSSDTVDVNGKTLTEAINGLNTSINGKANSVHTHGNGDITSLDASKITSGTIDIDRLPQGALDRLIKVANDTARFKLTTNDVQLGDSVKVTNTKKMYIVVDETKLSSEDGYEPYTADSATSVPWSGVTGKPSTYTPSSHTHTKSQITDFPTSMPANGGNSTTVNGHTVKSDVPESAVFTDTVYDDTEVKESIDDLNSNLDMLEFGEVAGGKNLWDEQWKIGVYNESDGVFTPIFDYFCSKNKIKVKPNTIYRFVSPEIRHYIYQYDINGNYIGRISTNENVFPTNDNVEYVQFVMEREYGKTYNHDIAIIEGTSGTYEPYIPSVKMLAEEVSAQKNDLDKLSSLPKGSIIQIEAAKDNIETTEQKYGWQYLGTSNIECNDGAVMILVTNVYRKNN